MRAFVGEAVRIGLAWLGSKEGNGKAVEGLSSRRSRSMPDEALCAGPGLTAAGQDRVGWWTPARDREKANA